MTANVLPPQANLFGFWDEDPRVVADVRQHLERESDFVRVWTPADGWVAASMPLPYGREPPESNDAIAFAEGADVVGALDRVIKLADEAPDRLDEIPGDFGFIRFRPRGEATVVRSAAGLAPFYIRSTPNRVAISTLIGDLVHYDPTESELDELAAALWTTGFGLFPDERAIVANVRVLRPGYVSSIAGTRTATHRYWDPRPRDYSTEANHDARALEFRDALVSSIRRELHPGGRNVVTLSGGVDSTSVAALAAGFVGYPIASLSLVPGDAESLAREAHYIDGLVAEYGVKPAWRFTSDRARHVEIVTAGPRGIQPVVHPALNYLRVADPDSHTRVLVGGEYSDELSGSRYTFVDWASHARVRDIMHPPNGPKDWLRVMKWRTRWALQRPDLPYPSRLGEWFVARVRDEYRDWLARHRRAVAHERGVWPYRWAWWHHDGFLAMNWEALTPLGIRRSFPFVQRRILEVAYQCHPRDVVGPPTTLLLKRAVDGIVRGENLHRPDKGTWVRQPGTTLARPALPERALEMVCPSQRDPGEDSLETVFGLTVLRVVTTTLESRRRCAERVH